MNKLPKAGLLPFYIKLYDDTLPEARAGFDGFIQGIATALQARGVWVETAPVCRVADEFDEAIKRLEGASVDCIITVHLAYSPSLEAIGAFCRTQLPVIIFDTTMDEDFGRDTSPDRIMYNHGVHGVMDFASMLRRQRRGFEILAGHARNPQALDAIAGLVRAAYAARCLRNTRVLRVGPAFDGMGDFAVPEEELAARLGVRAEQAGIEILDNAVQAVGDAAVREEIALDRKRYNCELAEDVHFRSVRVGLGLRHIIETGKFDAMSVNFQAFTRADRPANTMPFLEISKAMGRGAGYAGEGDVLTAALVGALGRVFGAVTFTEVFCPDWAGGALFLSHMGEISPSVAYGTPRIIEKPFPWGGLNPAMLTCQVQPGPAVYVNLAPGPGSGSQDGVSFSLIIAPVEVLEDTTHPRMRDEIRAWVRPQGQLERFLEAYSRAGGTHHSALVLGDQCRAIEAFGRFLGIETVRLSQAA
jgi:L-arabinose isomerase